MDIEFVSVKLIIITIIDKLIKCNNIMEGKTSLPIAFVENLAKILSRLCVFSGFGGFSCP